MVRVRLNDLKLDPETSRRAREVFLCLSPGGIHPREDLL